MALMPDKASPMRMREKYSVTVLHSHRKLLLLLIMWPLLTKQSYWTDIKRSPGEKKNPWQKMMCSKKLVTQDRHNVQLLKRDIPWIILVLITGWVIMMGKYITKTHKTPFKESNFLSLMRSNYHHSEAWWWRHGVVKMLCNSRYWETA